MIGLRLRSARQRAAKRICSHSACPQHRFCRELLCHGAALQSDAVRIHARDFYVFHHFHTELTYQLLALYRQILRECGKYAFAAFDQQNLRFRWIDPPEIMA